jgi:hypothetical protein
LRVLGKITAALALVWLLFTGFIFWAMHQPPERFGRIMKRVPLPAMMAVPFETLWNRARAGRLRPGDTAPEFRLATAGRSSTVQLADFRGSRPVILVFGSYT